LVILFDSNLIFLFFSCGRTILAVLDEMPGAILNPLLQALGLNPVGNLAARRKRLAVEIGALGFYP
jgi:hypothetical protein